MWLKGDTEQAIMALKGHYIQPTDKMQFGIDFHKELEDETRKTKKFPVFFTNTTIKGEVIPERKLRIKLLDWLVFSGIVDATAPEDLIIADYKTGSGSAGASASLNHGLQHKVYSLLNKSAKWFEYHHFNQYTKEKTMVRVHLTDAMREEALDIIISVASDIRATLEQAGISWEREEKKDE